MSATKSEGELESPLGELYLDVFAVGGGGFKERMRDHAFEARDKVGGNLSDADVVAVGVFVEDGALPGDLFFQFRNASL